MPPVNKYQRNDDDSDDDDVCVCIYKIINDPKIER